MTLAQLQALADFAASRYGIRADLVRAVIDIESGWKPGARGAAGEIGLMQLLPGGAIAQWTQSGKPAVDVHDPVSNVEVGTWYLGEWIPGALRQFGVPETVRWAIVAYNAGIGRARDAFKGSGSIPAVTQAYLSRIQAAGVSLDAPIRDSGGNTAIMAALGLLLLAIYR